MFLDIFNKFKGKKKEVVTEEVKPEVIPVPEKTKKTSSKPRKSKRKHKCSKKKGTCEDCGNYGVIVARGLCQSCYTYSRSDKPVYPVDKEHPEYRVVEDPKSPYYKCPICPLCGKVYDTLGEHLLVKHKVSASDVRKLLGKPKTFRMTSDRYVTKMRKYVLEDYPECYTTNLIDKGTSTRFQIVRNSDVYCRTRTTYFGESGTAVCLFPIKNRSDFSTGDVVQYKKTKKKGSYYELTKKGFLGSKSYVTDVGLNTFGLHFCKKGDEKKYAKENT